MMHNGLPLSRFKTPIPGSHPILSSGFQPPPGIGSPHGPPTFGPGAHFGMPAVDPMGNVTGATQDIPPPGRPMSLTVGPSPASAAPGPAPMAPPQGVPMPPPKPTEFGGFGSYHPSGQVSSQPLPPPPGFGGGPPGGWAQLPGPALRVQNPLDGVGAQPGPGFFGGHQQAPQGQPEGIPPLPPQKSAEFGGNPSPDGAGQPGDGLNAFAKSGAMNAFKNPFNQAKTDDNKNPSAIQNFMAMLGMGSLNG